MYSYTGTDPVALAAHRSYQVGVLTGAALAVLEIAKHQPNVPGPLKDALAKLDGILTEMAAASVPGAGTGAKEGR